MTPEQPKLKVIVVGAGIGGLACGAALRSFADVTILESVSEIKELGAAVHLAPNAHGVIQSLGGELYSYGSVPCKEMKEFTGDGKVKLNFKFDTKAEYGVEWILCHRVDVQAELHRLAIRPDGPGEPCQILLNSKVSAVDPESGTVTLLNGTTVTADVIVGADGIRSVTRSAVVGDSFHSQPSGHSAYRMLVPMEKVLADEELKGLGLESQLTVVDGGDRRIICYPCRRSELLNFVCVLPDTELNEISEEKWSARGDIGSLVKSFSSFSPVFQRLLSLGEAPGLWQLRDQDPLKTWVKGRCIIVGDAAHAMLPHQGQGASQALEDAEALGAFLLHSTRSTVPAALDRVFRVRYMRATRVQEFSRHAGLGEMRRKGMGLEEGEKPKEYFNMMKFRDFNWRYGGAAKWEEENGEYVSKETGVVE